MQQRNVAKCEEFHFEAYFFSVLSLWFYTQNAVSFLFQVCGRWRVPGMGDCFFCVPRGRELAAMQVTKKWPISGVHRWGGGGMMVSEIEPYIIVLTGIVLVFAWT